MKTIKFLGFFLDEKFTWKAHIEYIRNKVAKSIGIINKMRPVLNDEILLNMYYTFIHCYLNSGIIIWGSTRTNKIDSLIKLQKKAIRLITNSGYRAHTNPLFIKLKIIPLAQLHYMYYNVILMYKVYKNKPPKSIASCFTPRNTLPLRNTRQSNIFQTPNYINDTHERSILVRGPKYFNLFYRQTSINLSLSTLSLKYALSKSLKHSPINYVSLVYILGAFMDGVNRWV